MSRLNVVRAAPAETATDPRNAGALGCATSESHSSSIAPPQNDRKSHSSTALIKAELIGSDRCSALGLTATGHSPVFKLCRALVEAGCDPASALEAYRDDKLSIRVRSIGEGARLTVEDDRHGKPRLRQRKGARGCGAGSSVRQIIGPPLAAGFGCSGTLGSQPQSNR
jgi:hypothetical protein